MTNSDVFDYPELNSARIRDEKINTLMTAATGAATLLAVVSVVAFLGFIVLLGGAWLAEEQALAASVGQQHSSNFGLLLFGGSELTSSGGVLPAIVGTVVLTLLMAVIVAPLGIVVALYLTEYSGGGWPTQLLRIGVQNLAAIPSIIYGVFGLAFFVYVIGGRIDDLFYAPYLPTPTFGTPGLLWASLTLALLTLPTVIVATEEGLLRIPSSLREGSRALGATRVETIFRVVLPAAAPSILTGIILAVARAAGEVAPLMLVGVVRYAPTLPVSIEAPFLQLEQKFMHLGFYVYDLTMHAPGSEGRAGIVAAASLLLVSVIVSLNIVALLLRLRLRRTYVQSGV